MKHDLPVTLLLAAMFIACQVIGLLVLYNSMDIQVVNGQQQVIYNDTAIGERPDLFGFEALVFFGIAIAAGTALILFIMFIKKYIVWKILFLYAVVMTLAIAFGVFVNSIVAFALALVLGIWKLFRPNAIIHNVTEVFMYAGIAVLFVPMFNILWITVLLLFISVYDFIAVFKSKHMISMAQFQTQGNAFAGLLIKYTPKKLLSKKGAPKVKITKEKTAQMKKAGEYKQIETGYTNAILGGGDIVFPLMFAGVVLQSLISAGAQPFTAMLNVLVIPAVVSISLIALLIKGQRGKFYPAMPVITAGCLIGLGIVWLL